MQTASFFFPPEVFVNSKKAMNAYNRVGGGCLVLLEQGFFHCASALMNVLNWGVGMLDLNSPHALKSSNRKEKDSKPLSEVATLNLIVRETCP